MMRVGVYLGRHAGGGGGIGVYARELARLLPALLEHPAHQSDELVLYGDRSVLTEELRTSIGLGVVLSAEAEGALSRAASVYFRRLPNGAQARILLRILPSFPTHHLGMIYDQLFLPGIVRRDRIDLLHSTANHMLLLSGRPQLVTVHDLYQGWPLEAALSKRSRVSPLYRVFFSLQFRRKIAVVTDTKSVAAEIARRFQFEPGRMRTVRLGVDGSFMRLLSEVSSDTDLPLRASEFLERHGLQAGYALVLGSLDPRKNLKNTLAAWRALPLATREQRLVVRCESKQVETFVRGECHEDFAAGRIRLLSWMEREEFPLLYLQAGVLIVPTLGEGFGLPAIEASAVKLPVVTGPIEGPSGELSAACDPRNVTSITAAILKVISDGKFVSLDLRLEALKRSLELRSIRSMEAAVRETFEAYREAIMRAGGENRR